jgi:hypothetical protein
MDDIEGPLVEEPLENDGVDKGRGDPGGGGKETAFLFFRKPTKNDAGQKVDVLSLTRFASQMDATRLNSFSKALSDGDKQSVAEFLE